MTIEKIWNELEECINNTFVIPDDATGHEGYYIGFGEYYETSLDEIRNIKRLLDTILELRRKEIYEFTTKTID